MMATRRLRYWAALLAGVILCTACGSAADTPASVQQLGTQQAADAIARGVTTIDVRSEAEWAAGHVAGAQHVPVDAMSSTLPQLKLDPDAPVLLYCAAGGRASRAAETLRAAGFSRISVLKPGGFDTLRAAGVKTQQPGAGTPPN